MLDQVDQVVVEVDHLVLELYLEALELQDKVMQGVQVIKGVLSLLAAEAVLVLLEQMVCQVNQELVV
jgi:hypothetical protein